MANLQKKTKAELIMLCNERGSEIERLRKEAENNQVLVEKLNEDCDTLNRRYRSLEADFKGSEETFAQQIKEINLKRSEEVQALRDKVSERDKTISMQGESYKELKAKYDELVYENGINRSNAAKYKLTTIAFIILFVIALICACI